MTNREEKHLTPVWIVYVDGKRLDTEHEGALQKIHMDDVLDGVGACTLEFDTSAVRIAELFLLKVWFRYISDTKTTARKCLPEKLLILKQDIMNTETKDSLLFAAAFFTD